MKQEIQSIGNYKRKDIMASMPRNSKRLVTKLLLNNSSTHKILKCNNQTYQTFFLLNKKLAQATPQECAKHKLVQ